MPKSISYLKFNTCKKLVSIPYFSACLYLVKYWEHMSLCKSTPRTVKSDSENILKCASFHVSLLMERIYSESAHFIWHSPAPPVHPPSPASGPKEESTHSSASSAKWKEVHTHGNYPSLAFNNDASKNEVKSAIWHCRKTKALKFKRGIKFVYGPH